ncbi:MAG TPA: L-aspartate oxidase [Armatimonadota bacterium]
MWTEADFLVIGSGIAGLWAAIRASEHGSVVLVTKQTGGESNTNYAQGGIAGVMAADDDPRLHIEDTLDAGAGLCHQDTVELLAYEGPNRIRELMAFGAHFSTQTLPTGERVLALGMEGGHSRRRIVHAADLTGREIERALQKAVTEREKVLYLQQHMAVELHLEDGACRGALVLDREKGTLRGFRARATILATGGLGQIYQHTTNPAIATGDGIALAWRAGATVANMEFIQFHPTTLYHPEARSFLISEAVRGEGGVLRLRSGKSFMGRYDSRGDLAPRDIVARAIHAELQRTGDECAYLDVTRVSPYLVRERFPTIYARCLEYGIDMTKEWIPVVPACHYSCGGVETDSEARTSLPQLYACGEVACTGVHGANRLASNSLLEAVVFAERAPRHAQTSPPLSAANPPEPKAGGTQPLDRKRLDELTRQVKETMWHQVGIVRNEAGLLAARESLSKLREEVEDLFQRTTLHPDLCELRSMVTAGHLTVRCALLRKESRGLHFCTDYPEVDPTPRDTRITAETGVW